MRKGSRFRNEIISRTVPGMMAVHHFITSRTYRRSPSFTLFVIEHESLPAPFSSRNLPRKDTNSRLRPDPADC